MCVRARAMCAFVLYALNFVNAFKERVSASGLCGLGALSIHYDDDDDDV